MADYWQNIAAGFRRASEGMQQSKDGLIRAGEGLELAIAGWVEAGEAVRKANEDHGDLKESVARLERLVLEQQADIRALRDRLNGGT